MSASTTPAAKTAAPGCLRLEIADGIAWLIMDNEARLNAFTRDMWADLPVKLRAAAADRSVRVIILRGAGSKAFSAGADISEFGGNRTGAAAAEYDRINHEAFEALRLSDKPTIAMVHGYAFGGGCELAILCDLRWAADDASFSVPAAKLSLGYNPRWIKPMMGVMSGAKVKEMLYTGRRYSAAEALQMGLANAVVAKDKLEAETRAVAADIAGNGPLSVKAAKRSVDEMTVRPESADLAELDRLVMACFDSEDFKEGTRAFMEKRKPKFQGR